MSFFGSKTTQSFTLSISLKSSSVDLQLVRNTAKAKEVLLVERTLIFLENSQDPELYTSKCLSELSALLDRSKVQVSQLSANEKLDVQIALYAPWFTSSIVPITQKEPTVIDQHYLDKKLATFETDPRLHNLEKRIIRIKANGYVLNDLTKAKCGNVELSAYFSYVSSATHQKLRDILEKSVPRIESVTYVTSPILILDSVKRWMVNEDNVTFIYIGGEITEVGMIEDDALSHFVTFPIGKHDFLRELQSHVKTYDYDLLYQKEIQLKSAQASAQFEELKKKWTDSVVQSLNMSGRGVPSKVLVISDSKTRDFFAGLLTEVIHKGEQEGIKNHRIIAFDISTLRDIISYKTPQGDQELDLKLEALTHQLES